ncbi:enhanced serine sensitivity protein SseB C-terminal domain-containing protein [Cohnella panacarvi]|uniref:enhanced serine sensitivity protein SseB C-terminal domain-containing protein n=1 Tax=Cohnella panacarvi TaxID=400776 RepID=UPI00047BB269|nr:enhanced serine sensitivity protein SseB C-terminal domain-containing protein [Cohnella panacarvi]
MLSDQMNLDPLDGLLSAAIEESTGRYAFYLAFLEHELVVIGTVSDESTLQLKYVEMEGQLVLPVYSSWHKFHSVYGSKYAYIKIPAYLLLDAVELNDPWVLNPGFVPSKMIIPEELQTLKDGTILDYCWEQLSEQDRKAMLEERLTEIPELSFQVLIKCLESYPSIRKAYVTRIYRPSASEQPFPLVGLELDDSDRETASALIASINAAVRELPQTDHAFEFVVLDDAVPLAKSMKAQLQPVYVRKTIEDIRSMFR